MWSKIWNSIKGVIQKLIGKKDISDALHIMPTVSNAMKDAIELWGVMYKNQASWLHEPTLSNPIKIVSLGLPSFIASEKARMATLEMVTVITAPDTVPKDDDMHIDRNYAPKTRAEYLNMMYQLNLIPHIRRQLEYGIAKGGLVIKPYIYNKNKLGFTFCQADDFYPISFNSLGEMTEAAFTDIIVSDKDVYTRLEYHSFDEATRTVTVVNKAYKRFVTNTIDSAQNTNMLGVEIPLTSVSKWADLAPIVTINNVDRLLFAYFKMPEANTIDSLSPLGVSAYSRAVGLIREADLQYSRMIWEYEGGQMAIDIDIDALKTVKDNKGNLVEMPNQFQNRLYRKIDLNSEDTYEIFAPNLRDTNYNAGLNSILMRIEDTCGISRGTLSDITRSEAKTATEMLIMRQRSYSENTDIQKALQAALEDTVYVMNVYCDLYDLAPSGEYSISFTWDDSLISSPDEELQRRLTLMNSGIESRVNVRMWYFGETEDQARKAIEEATSEQKERTDALSPPQPTGQPLNQSAPTNNPANKTPKKPEDNKSNAQKNSGGKIE